MGFWLENLTDIDPPPPPCWHCVAIAAPPTVVSGRIRKLICYLRHLQEIAGDETRKETKRKTGCVLCPLLLWDLVILMPGL